MAGDKSRELARTQILQISGAKASLEILRIPVARRRRDQKVSSKTQNQEQAWWISELV